MSAGKGEQLWYSISIDKLFAFDEHDQWKTIQYDFIVCLGKFVRDWSAVTEAAFATSQ